MLRLTNTLTVNRRQGQGESTIAAVCGRTVMGLAAGVGLAALLACEATNPSEQAAGAEVAGGATTQGVAGSGERSGKESTASPQMPGAEIPPNVGGETSGENEGLADPSSDPTSPAPRATGMAVDPLGRPDSGAAAQSPPSAGDASNDGGAKGTSGGEFATGSDSGVPPGTVRQSPLLPHQCSSAQGCTGENERCYGYWQDPPSGTAPELIPPCESDDECYSSGAPNDGSLVCAGPRGCQRSCLLEDVCTDEERCTSGGICERTPCDSDADCFGNAATCELGFCRRSSCRQDSECVDYCVNGQCSKHQGNCMYACVPGCP